MNNIYNLVKEAIDKKMQVQLSATHYYLNQKNINKFSKELLKKAIVININNNKVIKRLNTFDDYTKLVKSGITSIYEPVTHNTQNFRIIVSDKTLSEINIINSLSVIKDRFIGAGLNCDIIKTNNKYGLKCSSKENYSTDKLYSFASEITKGIQLDLNELKTGKLKRAGCSLDDNGNEDVIINIGEI